MPRALLADVIAGALREDAPWGDVTSDAFVSSQATLQASIVAREAGVFVGNDVLQEVFFQVDPTLRVDVLLLDGEDFDAGSKLAIIEGSARSVLMGERVALNLVQRLSAIASLTSEYVARVSDTGARIVDTRKTTPGLRALEKYAVVCGGGHNHRFSLSDAAMVKDNHLAAAVASGVDVTTALKQARAKLGHTVHLEVEVDSLTQLDAVLAASPDSVLLDNFSLSDLVEGVKRVRGRALVEASGGVTLNTVRAIAQTGVDLISVGALTHSVKALDIGLDIVSP